MSSTHRWRVLYQVVVGLVGCDRYGSAEHPDRTGHGCELEIGRAAEEREAASDARGPRQPERFLRRSQPPTQRVESATWRSANKTHEFNGTQANEKPGSKAGILLESMSHHTTAHTNSNAAQMQDKRSRRFTLMWREIARPGLSGRLLSRSAAAPGAMGGAGAASTPPTTKTVALAAPFPAHAANGHAANGRSVRDSEAHDARALTAPRMKGRPRRSGAIVKSASTSSKITVARTNSTGSDIVQRANEQSRF